MRMTSILAIAAAATAFTASGISITVTATVDSHMDSVSLHASNQIMGPVGRNGNERWLAWSVDTAYTPVVTGVDEGYSARWKVTVDGAEVMSGDANTSITLQESHAGCTLGFYGEPNTYTATLNLQGGSNGTAAVTATYNAQMPAITPPVRAGYEFCGYYERTGGNGVQYYNADGTGARAWDKTSGVTLYAQWKAVAFDVTLDRQLGVNGTRTVSATYDEAMPAITPPARDGYVFRSYTTAPNGGGTWYYNADGTSAHTWDVASATTLYAHWAVITNTVLLNPQGGSGGTTNVTATYASPMPAITPPVRDGYEFRSYTAAPNGAGTRYYNAKGASARKWDQTTNATLYAYWIEKAVPEPPPTPPDDPEPEPREPGDLAKAVDAPELDFETFGTVGSSGQLDETSTNLVWFAQADFFNYGTNAAQSCGLPVFSSDGQVYCSWLTTTVTNGPGVLSFSWKCAAKPLRRIDGIEPKYYGDTLRFGLIADGGFEELPDVPYLDGDTDWQRVAYTNDTAGKITFAWVFRYADYAGDNYSNGGGTGWVDHVEWKPLSDNPDDPPSTSYTITLDRNYEGGGSGTTITVTYGADMGSVSAPSRPGYEFLGYFTSQEEGGDQYFDATGKGMRQWDISSNTTLYAHWAIKAYTVTLNQQNGSGGPESVVVTNGVAMPTITPPTRTGYSFLGYYQNPSGSGTPYYDADGSSVHNWDKTSNATIYAYWEPLAYSVTLELDGGATTNITVTFDVSMPDVTPPTRTGYTFGGYFSETNGLGKQYYDANGNSANAWDISSSNATLHAYWMANPYTLTFDSDGGSAVALIRQDCGTAISAPADPTKDGYTFAGWSPELPATVPASNVTYTAQWKPNTYTVKFDGNGADGTGTMSDQTFTYDLVSSLTSNVFTRIGHSFTGWTNSVGTAFADGAAVSNLTAEANGTATLYAQWKANEYTVTFDAGASTNTADITYGESLTNLPTRTGYAFGGYFTGTNGGGTMCYDADGNSVNAWDLSSSDATLYAHWTPNAYKVAFDGNGGTGTMSPMTCTYDVAQSLPSNTFTHTGHNFLGWSATPGGAQAYDDRGSFSNLTNEPNATVTLYAKWELATYTVTLDRQGADNGTASVEVSYGEAMPAVNPPTRTGYEFCSYTNSAGTVYYDANGTSADGVKWEIDANGTLYAKWTANTYTVKFDPNDGTGMMPDQTNTYDQVSCLTSNAFTRTGYSFTGWKNSVGTAFADGAAVSNLTAEANGTVTLYAQWTDSLADAVDAPNLEFSTFGAIQDNVDGDPANDEKTNTVWFVQGEDVNQGPYAVQSGALPKNTDDFKVYVSYLTTSVTGKGELSFYWKCAANSREGSYGDILRFGKYSTASGFTTEPTITPLSGSMDWAKVTYNKETDDAVTFAWAFMYQDGGNSNGGGTGYVDRVTWTPAN